MSKKLHHAILSLLFIIVFLFITIRLISEPGMIVYLFNFYRELGHRSEPNPMDSGTDKVWLLAWFASFIISIIHTYLWWKEVKRLNRNKQSS